jgi:CheY-like chemotaxis protein
MLLNLLSNAVKFTPSEGRVELRAAPLPGAGGIRVEVQDSGPGIPADKRHLLFEDFSQLVQMPGQEGIGTGLGLAISARLAAAMGGRIGCDEKFTGGALFWVELPLREVAMPPAQRRTGLPPPPEPVVTPLAAAAQPVALRVLVADDVAANRMVARAMLVAAGHKVDSAADGAEALAAVEREDYDVVLMDVQMPGMDGLEATRRIRELEGARGRVPILAVTASALPEQVAACRAAGMDAHLAKPIDRESLLAAVGRLAAGVVVDDGSDGSEEGSEPPLVDRTALANLASDLGPTAEVVIGEFLGELRLGVAALSAPGIAPGIAADAERLRQAAHRLLGAARTLGARRLARAIEALQSLLHAGQPGEEALRSVLDVAADTLPAMERATQPEPLPLPAPRASEPLAAQGTAA